MQIDIKTTGTFLKNKTSSEGTHFEWNARVVKSSPYQYKILPLLPVFLSPMIFLKPISKNMVHMQNSIGSDKSRIWFETEKWIESHSYTMSPSPFSVLGSFLPILICCFKNRLNLQLYTLTCTYEPTLMGWLRTLASHKCTYCFQPERTNMLALAKIKVQVAYSWMWLVLNLSHMLTSWNWCVELLELGKSTPKVEV